MRGRSLVDSHIQMNRPIRALVPRSLSIFSIIDFNGKQSFEGLVVNALPVKRATKTVESGLEIKAKQCFYA